MRISDDEHNDDIAPEVQDGAEVETAEYESADEEPGAAEPVGQAAATSEEPAEPTDDDDHRDSI